jgi:hypothetical protein
MAVKERSGEMQCAEVRRPRGFPPKIARDLPKIGRSRKRRESASKKHDAFKFVQGRSPTPLLLPLFVLSRFAPHS